MRLKKYHINLYKRFGLFEKGSWLEKPEDIILSLAENLKSKKNVKVLNLGSGVGRNSIPIAKIIGKNNGEVVCVDYLRIADQKLRKNAKEHQVQKYIKSYVCDVREFEIEKENFDLIIAHSILEHLKNRRVLEKVIKNIILGTKENGYNYICLTTELEEIEIPKMRKIKPKIEIPLTFENGKILLKKLYNKWKILKLKRFLTKKLSMKEAGMLFENVNTFFS